MKHDGRLALLISAIAAAIKVRTPTKLGSVTIGQANIVTAGTPVMLSAALSGAKSTDRLLFLPTVCPDNRQTGQCRCDVAGTVKVSVQGPGLTIADSYSITGDVYKIG